jgi:hypothetical protein
VSFAAPFYGETTSELTIAERGPPTRIGRSRVVWRQLETSTRLNLLGDEERGVFPEFGVEMEGSAVGTLVTMTYNFARIEMRGPLCFLGSCLPSLLQWHLHSSIGAVWHVRCSAPMLSTQSPTMPPVRRPCLSVALATFFCDLTHECAPLLSGISRRWK